MYLEGKGCEADVNEGAKWLNSSATLGNGDALEKLNDLEKDAQGNWHLK